MFSFLHVADIHLDSPLRGLARYEGAPVEEIRGATRQALDNLVNYALENAISLIVLAGDVYDADCPDFQTLLHFGHQMSRLGEHGVQVVMIRGNHDADNSMTASLTLPDNVTVLPSAKPGTWRSPSLPVAVHGQSYAGREVATNLVRDYPSPVPGLFNIGLLHTALSGRPGHAPYAPCTLTDLAAKGYDYWALGHVHEFEQVAQAPHVVFCGCLQGRHARETGAKGCVRVDVDDQGQLLVEQVVLDVLRWILVDVNISGVRRLDDLYAAVASALRVALPPLGNRLAAVRLRLQGQCAAHARIVQDPDKVIAQIRLLATDLSRHRTWIEKVLLDTTPELDLAVLSQADTPQAGLLRALKALEQDPDELTALGLDLRDVQARISGSGLSLPDLDDPKTRSALVKDVRNMLIPMLAGASGASLEEDHAH
ncbi:MAG TPA: DNA repair exonuclease [Desulfonatronum sp.]|nr:DNA repair exonuclease [Desulfonatronum sp.]